MADIDTSRLQSRRLNLGLVKWVLIAIGFYWTTMFWTSFAEQFDPHNQYALRFMLLFAAKDKSSPYPLMLSEFFAWGVAIFGIVICFACSKWATVHLWSLCEAAAASWSSMVAAIASLTKQGHIGPPESQAPPEGLVSMQESFVQNPGQPHAVPPSQPQMPTPPDSIHLMPGRVGPQDSVRPGEQETMSNPAGKLPEQKRNLSEFLDGAKLTEIQREVISLRLEHGFPVSAIAKRLGKSRKTIDEHIAAASKKIEYAGSAQKRAAKRAV